jgi:hypothetical protein
MSITAPITSKPREKPPHPPALGAGLRPHTYLQRYGVF